MVTLVTTEFHTPKHSFSSAILLHLGLSRITHNPAWIHFNETFHTVLVTTEEREQHPACETGRSFKTNPMPLYDSASRPKLELIKGAVSICVGVAPV